MAGIDLYGREDLEDVARTAYRVARRAEPAAKFIADVLDVFDGDRQGAMAHGMANDGAAQQADLPDRSQELRAELTLAVLRRELERRQMDETDALAYRHQREREELEGS